MAGRNKRQDGSLAEGNHSFDVSGDNDETSSPRRQVERTPLPKLQLFVISSIQFAEPITALVIYPFINQFVRDTGVTKGDERKTGYYAGIIVSFFLCCRNVFNWPWLSGIYVLLGRDVDRFPVGLVIRSLRTQAGIIARPTWPLVCYAWVWPIQVFLVTCYVSMSPRSF